jgi:hypothetical protein
MMSGLFKKSIKNVLLISAFVIGGKAYGQLNLTWGEMGPNDQAGRTRAIIVDRTDASGNTLYAAGVSGGIFRSGDAGANWLPVNDQAPSLIVSCMVQAVDGTIYFGTGETFSRGGNGAGLSGFNGSGLYKFSPGGSTISLVKDSMTFGNINEVAIDGANASKIYVASNKGFFVSNDAGATFSVAATMSGTVTGSASTAAMDVKVAPNNDVYFSLGTKATTTSKVYYSNDGGANFTDITPTTPSVTSRGRIEIALSPTNSNYVYLSIAKTVTISTAGVYTGGGLNSVWMSSDKGVNWTLITLGTTQFDPFSSGTKGFGDYCNTIVVDPGNPQIIYLAGMAFKSWVQNPSLAPGQGDWYQIGTQTPLPFGFYVHSKIHDIKFNAGQNVMLIATDGGIYKSVSGNSGFLSFNKGLNISQFNSVAFMNFPKTTGTPVPGGNVTPIAGVAGGSIGNDLIYLPGNLNNNPQTSNSLGSADAYQADFSKILPSALFYAGPFGLLYRTNNINSAVLPSEYNENSYAGAATGGPGANTFANENTPARLWENYGGGTTDSILFWNDTVRSSFFNSNSTATKFTLTNKRPQKSARYQNIVISATTSQSATPIPAAQSFTIYPKYEGVREISSYSVIGSANNTPTTNNIVVLNDSSLVDTVKFAFAFAPEDSATVKIKISLYYPPGPDTLMNTITTTTATGLFNYITLKRPTKRGLYKDVTIVDPSLSQTITIVPGYTGNSITSYTVNGTTNTASCNISLTTSTLNAATDTIRFMFDLIPLTGTTLSITTNFEPRDSIRIQYEDISGMPYTAGIPITSVFTNTTNIPGVTNLAIKKIGLPTSARYAVGTGGTNPSVFVIKRPLNFGTNPDHVKVAGKNSRIDLPGGIPSMAAPVAVVGSFVTKLEWANSGRYIYFTTKVSDTQYNLYRISHLEMINDSASSDYSGKFTFDIDSGSTYRRSPIVRTTQIGRFANPVTSISVLSGDSTLILTCGSYTNTTGTVYMSNVNVAKAAQNTIGTSYFDVKNGSTLPMIPAYASMAEMNDNRRVLVGTETGLYSTSDITAATPAWGKENGIPNVPVFQIRQQTLPAWLSYNSGNIYVATHGRGIWSSNAYNAPFAIGIEEKEELKATYGNNLSLYPNPASNQVNVWFNAAGEANYIISVYDISGRLISEQQTPKLMEGEQTFNINTNLLSNGVYFINVQGSNNFKGTSKLVVAH